MLYSGQESAMLRRSRTMNGAVSSGLPGNALTRSKTMPLKMSSAASCEIRFGCLETMPTQGLGSYSRIQYTSTLETIYEEDEEDCELTQSNEVASDTDTVQSSEVGSYTDAVQSSEAGSYNDLTRTKGLPLAREFFCEPGVNGDPCVHSIIDEGVIIEIYNNGDTPVEY